MRKYEIQVPLNRSDGRPIGQEKIGRVRDELQAEFGSFAAPNEKTWRYDGLTTVEMMKFEILSGDPATKKRLTNLKTRLKKSLPGIRIFITAHKIQVI